MDTLGKLIENRWQRDEARALERAPILRAHACAEGLDVERARATEAGTLVPSNTVAHVLSVVRGEATLVLPDEELHLASGVHVYLPAGRAAKLELRRGAELVLVSSGEGIAVRGRELLVRDEMFISACAVGATPLRWMLTPQYLSRRVFLHHDPVMLSRSGHPVSWFRTTMFDVNGLPGNQDGEPVFKMSYNSRTELNVCYDVEGEARVRMARHPYQDRDQGWSSWMRLHGDSTYCLNEAAGGEDEERVSDGGVERRLRNKHEVSICGGHVSLFCLFDPAPTGVERHRPGEYSDYEPFEAVAAREEYALHRREIARFDAMLDRLSLAKARGVLDRERTSEAWAIYEEGRAAQAAYERALLAELSAAGKGRDKVVARWSKYAGTSDGR